MPFKIELAVTSHDTEGNIDQEQRMTYTSKITQFEMSFTLWTQERLLTLELE